MIRSIKVVALSLALVGCDTALTQPPNDLIGHFLRSEGIPKVESVDYLLVMPEHSITLFRVRWGRQDCPSGCIRITEYGLRVGDRVGWVGPPSGRANRAVFDVLPTDSALFSAEFVQRVAGEVWVGWLVHELLADDPDTSLDGLLNIIDTLQESGWPQLGLLLLQNPKVAGSRTALEALASLRDTERYSWEAVRAEATRLLASLTVVAP